MIKQEIEKAAEEYANEFFSRKDKGAYQLSGEQVYNIIKLTFISSAKFVNKHWQEKTRWIPVEEKIPPRQSRTRQILGKNKDIVNVVFVSCTDEGYLNSLEYLKREFTDWKEIE